MAVMTHRQNHLPTRSFHDRRSWAWHDWVRFFCCTACGNRWGSLSRQPFFFWYNKLQEGCLECCLWIPLTTNHHRSPLFWKKNDQLVSHHCGQRIFQAQTLQISNVKQARPRSQIMHSFCSEAELCISFDPMPNCALFVSLRRPPSFLPEKRTTGTNLISPVQVRWHLVQPHHWWKNGWC